MKLFIAVSICSALLLFSPNSFAQEKSESKKQSKSDLADIIETAKKNISAKYSVVKKSVELNSSSKDSFVGISPMKDIKERSGVGTKPDKQRDFASAKRKDSKVPEGQDEKLKKYEIGFQTTWLHQKSFNENSPVFDLERPVTGPPPFPSTCCQTEFGFGGRFTYNFTKNIAGEIEANFFPVDRLNVNSDESIRIMVTDTDDFVRNFVEPQGRKLQIVAGPKIGIRKKKFGIFGKVRPGIYWVGEYPVVLVLTANETSSSIGGANFWTTFFSVDVGGVFEYYPTKKTILRFDIGDTIIRYRALDPKPFNPGFTRHTFQFTTGFGWRF